MGKSYLWTKRNRLSPWESPALKERMEEEEALKVWRNNSQRGRKSTERKWCHEKKGIEKEEEVNQVK